jgi:hypothetical protein
MLKIARYPAGYPGNWKFSHTIFFKCLFFEDNKIRRLKFKKGTYVNLIFKKAFEFWAENPFGYPVTGQISIRDILMF